MTIADIAQHIRNDTKQKHLVLIGIEGFGGSGKTTISKQLAEALGDAYIIHIDDFIVKEKLPELAWDTGVFDHVRLENQVLQPASLGEPIIYQRLLYDDNRLGEPITLPSVRYVIVEGISCYILPIRHYYDFKIWVDTPIEIAMSRGIARNGTHGSVEDWKKWAEIDDAYLQKYRSNLIANFITTNR
jgi:uridine kinase